jgi:hypothetical protein
MHGSEASFPTLINCLLEREKLMYVRSFWLRLYLPACLIASLVMAVSLLDLPHAPSDVTLDESWRTALSYFALKKFQFGPQVIFTYGPLGYLTESHYIGGDFTALLLGATTLACVGAGMLGYIGWCARSYLILALLVAETFAFGAYGQDAIFLTTITALACFCIALPASPTLLCMTAIVMSFSSLGKFTYLLLSGALASAVLAFLIVTRQRRSFAVFLSILILSFVGLWVGPSPVPSFRSR